MSLKATRRSFLKNAALLTGGLAGATWLAGCAPKAEPAAEEPKAEEPAAPKAEGEAVKAPEGKVEIRYMDRAGSIGDYARHFSRVYEERNPGIIVKNETTSWGDLTTKVPTFVAAGTMADMAFQHGALMLPELGAKGAWLNLEPLGERDGLDWDIYYPWALDSLRQGPNGELIASPESVHIGQSVCGWNLEMLEEMGFGTPSEDMTIPDFVDLLINIQSKMPEGGFAVHMGSGAWDMQVHSRSFGGYLVSDDRESCGFALEKTQDAHRWQYDLINTYKVLPGRDQILGDQRSMFYSGMLAMVFNSPNNIWAGFEAGVEGRFHLGVSQFPHGGEGMRLGGAPSCNATAIYSKTKYPDESWGLAKLLASYEASKWAALSPSRVGPGAIIEAWNDPEVWEENPIYKSCALAWKDLTTEDVGPMPVPMNTRRAEFFDLFGNEWQAMLFGDKPYDDANVTKLQEGLQAIMDKPAP
jgi:ABC-type glycerol-3-phosphate transport system substrate-binding protein